jgi:hypothetical protein
MLLNEIQPTKNEPTAEIRPDGTKRWYLNGVHHREDGPAVESPDGTVEWWFNGEQVAIQKSRPRNIGQR